MQEAKKDWTAILFLVGYHLALLIGLPLYFMHHSLSWQMGLTSGVLMYISGISITAGYHRLYSHTTYKTNKIVEAVFLFLATLATQGSALKWASDHRKHHAFVDTDRDPYSIKKGFWYAHFLWMFDKMEPVDPKVVADLLKNPLLVFQHKYYGWLMFGCNALVTLIVGYCLSDYLGALVFAWGVRMLLLHHFTWFINSLAHTWGDKPYSREHSAIDLFFLSIFTFGEGYHNYHHTFASDYRNGVFWYQFDPAKWIIWVLDKCNLAWGLRRTSRLRIHEKMILARKEELLEQMKTSTSTNRAFFEEKMEQITQTILSKFSSFNELLQSYKSHKSESEPNKDLLRKLSLEIKQLKRGLKEDWKTWRRFSKEVSLQFG